MLDRCGRPFGKLKEIIREYEDGLVIGGFGYTVADAVQDWLAFGLSGRDGNSITKCTILANTHIIPALGARKLRDLPADDIDIWLADKAQVVSTRTLREVRSVLNGLLQIRPAIVHGADVMDRIFPGEANPDA